MPALYLVLGFAAIYLLTQKRGATTTAGQLPATAANGAAGAIQGGLFGQVAQLFPGPKKITRQPGQTDAQTTAQSLQAGAAFAPALAGLFKDLGQAMTPASGSTTPQTQDQRQAQAAFMYAQAATFFPWESANSSLGADQTVSGKTSVNDLGLDQNTSLGTAFANTFQPGDSIGDSTSGASSDVTPDPTSWRNDSALPLDLSGSPGVVPQDESAIAPIGPGSLVQDDLTDYVAMSESMGAAEQSPELVSPISSAPGASTIDTSDVANWAE